ncbi:MAG: ATP-binding protein [Salinivirgaceae bacterium]|jgi:C4-dicarboxylate-specific signal transduction histidine kinase|nr:ATP-binding protein [Salinivirgaceae bacterium]
MEAPNVSKKEKWVLYILAPLLVIVISLIIEYQYRNIRQNKDSENHIKSLGKKVEDTNYSLALKNVLGIASMSYVEETVIGNLPVDNIETVAGLLAIRKASDAQMVYLMNKSGEVVACTPDSVSGQSFTGNNFAFRPYFSKVVSAKQYEYYPAVGVVSLKRGFYLGVPIYDSLNIIRGVAAIKTGVESIEETLYKQSQPCAIISPDGIVYAANNTNWLFKSTHSLSNQKLNSLKESKQFADKPLSYLGCDLSNKKVDIQGVEYRVKAYPIFSGNWKVMSLYKPYTFNFLFFFIIFGGLSIFLSGFYFAFRISRKLKKINYLTGKQERYSQRIFNQQEAIIHLNKSQIQLKNWEQVRGLITETASRVLKIERSSIWLFNKEGNEFICDDRYLRSRNEHEKGQKILEIDCPLYFAKLKNEDVIVSNNVSSDANLKELANPIFEPKSINAVIHIPILQQGKPFGVVCFEHVDQPRIWNNDEKIFCERLANRVSLFLVIQQRRITAKKLKESNQSFKVALEEANRSKELEIANGKLREKEKILQKAYDAIQMNQIELTKLNKKLVSSHQYTLNLNNELVEANTLLGKQKSEVLSTLQQLKDTQSHLVHAEKMASVGILTAGIAHEINNPLNFIQGGKTALELHVYDNYKNKMKDFRPMFEMIESGINRATEIINSLNHFNRKSEDLSEICSLHAILDNCLVILHNQLKYKIDVEKSYTEKVFCLMGNEGKLHQVFLNVIANAEQAIEGNGKIEINTSLNDSYIKTTISDTGNGIEQENLKKITDPFFTTKEPGKGTGLGLSIALSIIQEHNGIIEYQSMVNKGTSVTISLPIAI